MKKKKLNLKKSNIIYKKAVKIIPYGSQTYSKGIKAFSDGASPKFLAKGKGCQVWDVDGNKYIDYVMACQPLILGYADPDVNKAVTKQLKLGSTFSISNELELEVSELMIKHIPGAEAVRFGKNGADATSIAVRMSRAITKRDHIAFCGYHGWHDWFVGTTDLNAGIPKFNEQLAHSFSYNDIDSLERIFKKYKNKIACVIMEPITVAGPKSGINGSTKWKDFNSKKNFLIDVKKICRKNGALLVFDEVVTGFRYDMGGAQKMFNIIPDLSCFAKAMSNGIPVSAITGKKEYMKFLETTFFSFTYGGDCVGLAAAKACINKLDKKNVIDHLYKVGKRLKDGMNELINLYELDEILECSGYPCRTVMTIKNYKKYKKPLIIKSLIQQELMIKGVLWSQYHSISFSHKNSHIDHTLNAFEDSFKKLKKIVKNNKNVENYLYGKPCQTVFTRVADFQSVATSQKIRN